MYSVLIIVGSDSDLPVIENTAKILDDFQVKYKIRVASAHRTPDKVKASVRDAEKNGAGVIIAAAGMAAALPGVVAAETVLPVIGVPLESKAIGGIDALLSIVQMPKGIPVGTVAIGKTGAANAALLAVRILAVGNPGLSKKLEAYRKKMASSVEEKDSRLQKLGIKKYVLEKQ
jgi:5-(carboxyamino)imidazole ribonucleotide mutase